VTASFFWTGGTLRAISTASEGAGSVVVSDGSFCTCCKVAVAGSGGGFNNELKGFVVIAAVAVVTPFPFFVISIEKDASATNGPVSSSPFAAVIAVVGSGGAFFVVASVLSLFRRDRRKDRLLSFRLARCERKSMRLVISIRNT
jgi:hypothetical protein